MSRIVPQSLLIVAAAALLAQPARALGVSVALPQTGSGTATSVSAGGARRGPCATCATPAERRLHQKLLMRVDSIRWEIENRRMNDEERLRASQALLTTLDELTRLVGEGQRIDIVRATPAPPAPQGQGPGEAVPVPPTPYAIARRGPTRGYLGVTFEGLSSEMRTPTDHSVRFFNYPRIALVEPSSPAERAGVLRGDTVLAFNGTDVMSEVISFTKLLVPDTKITMRVRRDGSSRDLKVVVGEAPEYYVRRREPTAYVAGGAVAVGGTPEPARAPVAVEAPRVYVVPPRPQAVTGFRYYTEYQAMAGASFQTITEAWSKALRVDEGVLVTAAVPGTPAYRSGLREGDVIIRADGNKIRTVANLRSVLSEGDGAEGVKLVILRERKEREIALRWER